MALTLAEADQMIASARCNLRIPGLVYHNRFTPAARAIKQVMEEGRFGRLVLGSASIKWYRSQVFYDSSPWRGTWAVEGGAMMNQSSHSLDLRVGFIGQWSLSRRIRPRSGTRRTQRTWPLPHHAPTTARLASWEGQRPPTRGCRCGWKSTEPTEQPSSRMGGGASCGFEIPGRISACSISCRSTLNKPPVDQPPSLADNWGALLDDFIQAIRQG